MSEAAREEAALEEEARRRAEEISASEEAAAQAAAADTGPSPDTAQPNRDRYDRLLRYVDHPTNTGDADIARELLASGAARRYEAGPVLAREESYSTAIEDAQDAQRGLWGKC